MANKITEKYFTQNDFSRMKDKVLAEVTAETGFIAREEIFRGVIYERQKVGSLIYKGTWQRKPAALKLQGLKPEVDEGEIVKHFTGQNNSRLIRVPKIYVHFPWQAKRGYGYLITEYVDAPKIFKMPFATAEQMLDFARFYQEYRTSALTRPWLEPETLNSLAFTLERVNHWRKISESKKRLSPEEYRPYLTRFYPQAEKHLPTIPMVFCHGHLTADDIYKLADGSYVVLSNLFWSYRPEWYDLGFNIWACWQGIRDTSYTFEEMLGYIEEWLKVYRQIPVVKKDNDFERKITMLLLERTMGTILVDLGANDFFDKKKNAKYLRHLLSLNQKLFNYLVDKLEY